MKSYAVYDWLRAAASEPASELPARRLLPQSPNQRSRGAEAAMPRSAYYASERKRYVNQVCFTAPGVVLKRHDGPSALFAKQLPGRSMARQVTRRR